MWMVIMKCPECDRPLTFDIWKDMYYCATHGWWKRQYLSLDLTNDGIVGLAGKPSD